MMISPRLLLATQYDRWSVPYDATLWTCSFPLPLLVCSKWFIVTGLLSNLFPFQSPNLIFASPLFFSCSSLLPYYCLLRLCFLVLYLSCFAFPYVPANPSPPSLIFSDPLLLYSRIFFAPTFFLLSRPLRLLYVLGAMYNFRYSFVLLV